MKVHIFYDEDCCEYFIFNVNITTKQEEIFDIDLETLKRWKQVSESFKEVQKEIAIIYGGDKAIIHVSGVFDHNIKL